MKMEMNEVLISHGARKPSYYNGVQWPRTPISCVSVALLIGALVVPPVGSGTLHPSQTSGLTDTLDAFNTGLIGPGACPE